VLVSGTLGSCAMHRELIAQPALDASTAAPDWSSTKIAKRPQRILGFRTVDGVYHRYESRVRLVGDSLEFTAVPRAEPPRVVRSATEVSSVDLFSTSDVGFLLAVVVGYVVVGLALYITGAYSVFGGN